MKEVLLQIVDNCTYLFGPKLCEWRYFVNNKLLPLFEPFFLWNLPQTWNTVKAPQCRTTKNVHQRAAKYYFESSHPYNHKCKDEVVGKITFVHNNNLIICKGALILVYY